MKDESAIFGLRPVIEAIEAGKTIDKIFVQKGLQGEIFSELRKLITEYEITVSYVPVEKLNRFTGKNHQGVYAFVSPIEFDSIENVLPQIWENGKTPFILILDRISDVRNFGAIARTAECVGVDAIIIPLKGSASVNADAIKTSTGALYNIPVCKEGNLVNVIRYLQSAGISVYSASEKSADFIYDADFSVPTAIVMGSEEDGVSDSILKVSDKMIKLPMTGQIASLNVSVAAGAILYEAVRQRINQDLF